MWTVSAGNAAQGVALAARKAGARSSVLVMDTAPDTKLRAIERLGATIVQAPYDECWRTVEAHRSDRMQGHFVHPFDDDHFISGNGTIGLEILEDLPDVDAVVAPLGGGGLLAGVGVRAAGASGPRPASTRRNRKPPRRWRLRFAAGRASTFDAWRAVVRRRRRRPVGPASRCGRSSQAWVSESIVVSLDEAARAMRLVAERVHVIAEGAAAAPSRRPCRPRWPRAATRKSSPSSRAATSISKKFAELVGAGCCSISSN